MTRSKRPKEVRMDDNENLNKMTYIKQKKKILRERADFLTTEVVKEEITGDQFEALEFLLTNERYAIDANYVSEVILLKELTQLPCTPDFILGIINVRGKVIAVIDIKKFFNLPEKGITELNRVIVVKHQDIELGILADEIIGSTHIFPDKLQTSIPTITGINNDYLVGVTEDRLIILNIKDFLLDEKIIINEEI